MPVVAALACLQTVIADEYDDAVSAYFRADYTTAFSVFAGLSEQGDARAQHNLGLRYFKGQGVTQDYIQAHGWFNLAASQGNKTARENRDSIAKRMTPGQIAEAQALASQWAAKYNQ